MTLTASHVGVAPEFDDAIAVCRRAGFKDILLRGDNDFSITTEFDAWDGQGVRFIFGYNAWQSLVAIAAGHSEDCYADTGVALLFEELLNAFNDLGSIFHDENGFARIRKQV